MLVIQQESLIFGLVPSQKQNPYNIIIYKVYFLLAFVPKNAQFGDLHHHNTNNLICGVHFVGLHP
jgi:hypothetical protein